MPHTEPQHSDGTHLSLVRAAIARMAIRASRAASITGNASMAAVNRGGPDLCILVRQALGARPSGNSHLHKKTEWAGPAE